MSSCYLRIRTPIIDNFDKSANVAKIEEMGVSIDWTKYTAMLEEVEKIVVINSIESILYTVHECVSLGDSRHHT